MGDTQLVDLDTAYQLEIDVLRTSILSIAKDFTAKDLYLYEVRLSTKNFYDLLVECEAIREVFGLQEFTVQYFNMATQKFGLQKLVINTRSSLNPSGESEEELSSYTLESEEEVEVIENEITDADSYAPKIISFMTNTITSIVLTTASIILLKNLIPTYSSYYTPIIMGVVIMVVCTLTVTSWYSKEFLFLHAESQLKKNKTILSDTKQKPVTSKEE